MADHGSSAKNSSCCDEDGGFLVRCAFFFLLGSVRCEFGGCRRWLRLWSPASFVDDTIGEADRKDREEAEEAVVVDDPEEAEEDVDVER